MIGRVLYSLWAALVFGALLFVQYFDLASPRGTMEPRTNPTSLRDNPGAVIDTVGGIIDAFRKRKK